MSGDDKGSQQSVGHQPGEITHDEGKVDADQHGWAPDIDSPEGQRPAADSGERADAPQPGPEQSDSDAPPPGTGESTTRGGEEVAAQDGKEPGRHDTGPQGPSGRPAGTSDSRDSSGLPAEDPEGPTLPAGDGGG